MGERQRRPRAWRDHLGTTIATYALLSLAGAVSFVLPDSVDVQMIDVTPAAATPDEREAAPSATVSPPGTDESDARAADDEAASARANQQAR